MRPALRRPGEGGGPHPAFQRVGRGRDRAKWLDACGQMASASVMSSVFDLAAKPSEVLVDAIRAGLPARTFGQVADALNLSKAVLAKKLGIATRTINRKTGAKRTLSPEESEKILRVARIRNLANDLFTTDAAISEWLAKPASALHDAAPIDLLDTEVGAREVEGFIRGVLYGNFQ